MEKVIKKHFRYLDTQLIEKIIKESNNDINEIIKSLSILKKHTKEDYYTINIEKKAKKYTSLLPKIKFNSYLDIGSCTGELTLAIGKDINAKKIVGIDIEEWGEINSCKNRLDIVKIYDGRTIPSSNNSFDLVSIIFTLHHIPDFKRIISEAIRVLKPNGYLLIAEHSGNNQKDIELIDFDHYLYLLEKTNNIKSYNKAFEDYYSKYFTFNQLKKYIDLKLIKYYFYPDDIFRRYVAVYQKN